MLSPIDGRSRTSLTVLLLVAAVASAERAAAQTACLTSNCVIGGVPARCANRATPRTPLVLMTTIAFSNVFDPADPKIEPGDCIEWRSDTSTHSSSADPCANTDLSCSMPSPPGCLWETGNVASSPPPTFAVCHYDPALFPAGTGDGYYCRIHDTPQHTGTMHGTLRVTTAIRLQVDKDRPAGDIVLSWTGGGVTGDSTYKVVRNDVGNPAFPPASNQTFDPTGGPTGTNFRDVLELAGQARYYLVRNRQANE